MNNFVLILITDDGVTYGRMSSLKLLNVCLPTMMMPSWIHSSIKQPAGSHCNNTPRHEHFI